MQELQGSTDLRVRLPPRQRLREKWVVEEWRRAKRLAKALAQALVAEEGAAERAERLAAAKHVLEHALERVLWPNTAAAAKHACCALGCLLFYTAWSRPRTAPCG